MKTLVSSSTASSFRFEVVGRFAEYVDVPRRAGELRVQGEGGVVLNRLEVALEHGDVSRLGDYFGVF